MGGKKASKAAANEAAQARAEEEARQARIKGGTEDINRIFYGGTKNDTGSKVGLGATYDPNTQYFRADGSVYTPTSKKQTVGGAMLQLMSPQEWGSQFSSGAEQLAGYGATDKNPYYQAYLQDVMSSQNDFGDLARKGELYTRMPSSTTTQGQFNDDFFNSIADNYNSFAMPQLQDQQRKASDDLTYDLARTGNLDSSTRATKGSELQKAYDLNKQSIADKALNLKNQTKSAVEDARYNVISQLNATGDADGAAQAAMARASALSQPSMDFSPLTGLFADFTSGLGNAYAQERAYAASGGASHAGGTSFGNAATGRKGTVAVRG